MVSPSMSIEQVYWSILAIFVVLVILSWWIASGEWSNEDRPAKQHMEQDEQAQKRSD
jgi:hypothetical protein